MAKKFDLAKKYKGQEYTVWAEFIELAAKYQPVNLGQGFSDYEPPQHVTTSLAEVAESGKPLLQQYSRGYGHVRLVDVLSKVYSPLIERPLDPKTELITTAGAYEALFCVILSQINPGDEVILIEPFFDCYEPMVRVAGGTPIFIPLRPSKTKGKVMSSDWKLDIKELKSAFSKKTKMFILNTPHNPTGKVFSPDELQIIADLCKKWNVLVVADEVYEWMVFDPAKHVRICTLPGMWDQTVTIGSAGKTFSVTGWKIGWAYGPANLIKNMQIVHQNVVNSVNTPAQEAVARGLEKELIRRESADCYLVSLAKELKAKRDLLVGYLTEIGMVPIIPEGGYFVTVDWTPLSHKAKLNDESDRYTDFKFAKWMSKNVKVQGIPLSAFYSIPHKKLGEKYIRYCFIKDDDTLNKAGQILRSWAGTREKL